MSVTIEGPAAPQRAARAASAWRRAGAALVAVSVSAEVLLLAPLALTIIASAAVHPRIAAVAATALTLAVPISFGFAALAVSYRVVRRAPVRWGPVEIGSAGALGLIILLLLAQAQATTSGLWPGALGLASIVTGLVTWIFLRLADITRLWESERTRRWQIPHRRDLLGVGFAIAVGLLLALWYRWDSPPPYHPQWDAFAHLRIIDRLMEGFWSPWTTDYSSTFRVNAYFPLQQLTVAIASTLTGSAPIAVYWGGPYVIMPLTGAVAYFTARSICVGPAAAALAGAVTTVAAFPFQATAFLGLLPLSLAMPFASLALISAGQDRPTLWRSLAIIVMAGGAATCHWALGAAVAVLGLGLVALRAAEDRYPRFWMPSGAAVGLVACALLLGYAGFTFLPTDRVSDPDPSERDVVRTVSLAARQTDFERRLSPILFAASAAGAGILVARAARRVTSQPIRLGTRVGILSVGFDPSPNTEPSPGAGESRAYVAAGWAAVLIAVFAPVAGADRLQAIFPAVLAPTIARTIRTTIDIARLPAPISNPRRAFVATGMAVAIILASLPADRFRSSQRALASETAFLSSFDRSEWLAGEAIGDLTPTTSFLVSDPLSQEILGGFGDRESYGGGPYASDQQLMRLRQALTAATSRDMWGRLHQLAIDEAPTRPVLIAVTGRTAEWLAEPQRWWVGYPRHLEAYASDPENPVGGVLERLGDERWFQTVWIDREVKIYALRPEQGAPVEGLTAPAAVSDVDSIGP